MNEQKILLSSRKLPDQTRIELTREIGSSYEIRTMQDLDDSEIGRIEILLLDTAVDNDRKIISGGELGKFSGLKLIQSTRAGVDVLDFRKIPPNVLVCGNIGAYGEQMAEHVFGMVLYFARNIGKSDLELKQGDWEIPTDSIFLKGKTMVLIGAGGIGKAVASIASCFGMKTIGVNSTGKSLPNFDEVVSIEKLDEVLVKADVTVVSLPLTVKTFHLIDKQKLRAMKRNSILVNVARGFIIDELALFQHLKENPSFKCALDVWWWYPKQGEKFSQKFPFFDLPNFLGTPHDSGVVPETEELALLGAIENIGRFVRNDELKGVMDRQDYIGLSSLIAKEKEKKTT
ncbi:MAG: 2-hydroxyacid dehydrogenase [Thaumarchaeota archaeon]|nr:2-hydroxyacid dehydrogenase [Nitrososphaerota archaeon]